MRSGKRTGRASEADAAKDRQRGPRDERGVLADQILKAARASFASRGYGATSLRSVAHDAGVDPALVSYYFESKAGLLDAVLVLPDGFLEGITAAASAPLRKRGAALVQASLSMWDDPQSAEILRAIILTANHEQVAMDRIREVFAVHILRAVSDNLSDDERSLRAGLVASQIVGLAITRYVWKIGSIATIPSSQVVDLIGPAVQRYLVRP